MMREPVSVPVDQQLMGSWSIYVNGVNRTFVRGIPVTVESMSDTDPFGPGEASLTFPMISPLEPIGMPGSELGWLRPDIPIQITWTTWHPKTLLALDEHGIRRDYHWRGYITGFEWNTSESEATLSVTCTGALRMLDNVLAHPRAARRPWTYEYAIKHVINDGIRRSGLKLETMHALNWEQPGLEFWKRTFDITDYKDLPKYLVPIDVNNGDKWTGMLTRERGQWDKLISSYVAGLINMMYTEQGRFTVRLAPDAWKPVLKHINMYESMRGLALLHVNAAAPGVSMSLSADYTQTVNAVYGEVNSVYTGTVFNNEQWSANGAQSYFEPFAISPYVNPGSNDTMLLREQHIKFADGLRPDEAMSIATSHINRNSEPGYTGTITLNVTDPSIYDTVLAGEGRYNIGEGTAGGELVPFPKQLIQAGMSVQLNGFQGRKDGVVLFINEVSQDVTNNTATLTVDNKFRDFITTQEIAVRGRDAMRPTHLMTVGQYDPIYQERLIKWSYSKSGYIPYRSNRIWSQWLEEGGKASKQAFPWTNLTKRYPPKDPANKNAYLTIEAQGRGKKSRGTDKEPADAGRHWSRWEVKTKRGEGLTYLSAAGDIAAFKMMCVDDDGNILPVSYHVSLWWSSAACAIDTPLLPKDYKVMNGTKVTRHYKKGTPYPFYPWAWEPYKPLDDNPASKYPSDEDPSDSEFLLPTDPPIVGYGNFWDRPGYWPGSEQLKGARRTGLFVDETGFSFNMIQSSVSNDDWDTQNRKTNDRNDDASIQVLVFCDEALDKNKHFIGRLYRREPGQG